MVTQIVEMPKDDDFDALIITSPARFHHALSVKFNPKNNMFEGLPKEYRELLEMSP
jgi:hypothetical protein